MTAFLFLQRFDDGAPAPMPFEALMEVLSRHGVPGRGRGDTEFTLPADQMAAGCTVIGNPAEGAACVGFERPRFDAALRSVVWECIASFGCTVFDDTLDTVYTGVEGQYALAADFVAACANGVRQAGAAQQLWPEQLELAVAAPPRPALRYPNPNANGPNLQFCDDADFGTNELYIELRIRPEACNPGTLRVLRNLELRVDAAISTNPQYRILYRYAHLDSSLRLMESARLGEHANHVTLVSPMTGWEAPRSGFVADRDVFAGALTEAAALSRHVQQKYQLELDGSAASVDALARVLDKLHAYYRQELAKHPAGGAPFTSATATSWALKAGCYLGTVIQRQLGGQWGYVARGQQRLPVVRTHRGRTCHPHLQVLDHIVNGPRASIAGWFGQLARTDTSATPRGEDLACDIPGLCHILLGASQFEAGGLPLENQIPREKFDFSLESLVQLDRYLALVARYSAQCSEHALSNLVLAAGAYVGEVVRGSAPAGTTWQWVSYDDYAHAHPDFSAQRPREPAFMAFLDGDTETAYPFAHVAALLAQAQVVPTRAFAGQLAGAAPAIAPAAAGEGMLKPAAINAWPSDAAMAAALGGVRTALDDWRGSATPDDYLDLREGDSGWLRADPLGDILETQALLLSKGTVAWGALVQANNALFEPGEDDLPAALLYSLDPHFEGRPQALRRIAGELFAHKGHDVPLPLRQIAHRLEDGLDRFRNVAVPGILTDRKVLISVFMVFRGHLPGGVLAGRTWFPVLAHPYTHAMMIVPRQFWPPELVARWEAGELAG